MKLLKSYLEQVDIYQMGILCFLSYMTLWQLQRLEEIKCEGTWFITESEIGKDVTENNHALFWGIMPIIIQKEWGSAQKSRPRQVVTMLRFESQTFWIPQTRVNINYQMSWTWFTLLF